MAPDPDRDLMNLAGSLLSRRAFSRGELRDRLSRLGEAQQIESLLDRLEQLRLLNDADYAYNFASRWMLQEGWGPIKVLHLLLQRKVPAPVAEAAIDKVHQEVTDTGILEAYVDRFWQTHPLPEHPQGIRRLISRLQRRGFPEDTIRSVLRHKLPPAAWLKLEMGE